MEPVDYRPWSWLAWLFSLMNNVFRWQGKEAGRMIEKPMTKQHSATQTDTHFYEDNIVSSYEWNEWELRRKAMKLVCMSSPSSLR